MNNKISIGNSGEYFVAGELERRGFTVAVPMSNVKDFDILIIQREEPNKQFAIQVKTTSTEQKRWRLGKKNEGISKKNIFYIFVCLNGESTPEYHIVPSKVVAKAITADHEKWLITPGLNGRTHNDNDSRFFHDEEDKYLNRWDLLK